MSYLSLTYENKNEKFKYQKRSKNMKQNKFLPCMLYFLRSWFLLCAALIVPTTSHSAVVFSYVGTPHWFEGKGISQFEPAPNTAAAVCNSEICNYQLRGLLPPGKYTPDGYNNVVGLFNSSKSLGACPLGIDPVPDTGTLVLSEKNKNILASLLEERFASGIRFNYSGSGSNYFLSSSVARYEASQPITIFCNAPTTRGGTRRINSSFYYKYVFDGVPPGQSASVCTFGGKDLSLTFESISASVSIEKTVPLSVICGSGIPVNYRLSLSSALSYNGQLSFGNGVYASVSFNGTPLPVNGDWIRLVELRSGTNNLKVSLTGSASTPGVSTATGVLLLEIL
ncbi:TPA: hypothetical protein I8564_005089 [Raoultella ornithinolytica]|nr:hypothetical protein [Raoultella ornithinolytica]